MKHSNNTIKTPDAKTLATWEQEIKNKIKQTTQDFISTAKGLKLSIRQRKFFNPADFFQLRKQAIIPLVNALHFMKAECEQAMADFKIALFDFQDLVVQKKDEKLVQAQSEKGQFNIDTAVHKNYTAKAEVYIKGAKSKERIIKADAELAETTGEGEKAQHYLQAIRQTGFQEEMRSRNHSHITDVAVDNIEQATKAMNVSIPEKAVQVKPANYPAKPNLDFKDQQLNVPAPVKNIETKAKHSASTNNSQTDEKIKKEEKMQWTKGGLPYWEFITQTYEAIVAFGKKYWFTLHSKEGDIIVDDIEIEGSPTEELQEQPIRRNNLSHLAKSKFKVFLLSLTYICAVVAEGLVYSSILGEVYHFSGWKLVFMSSMAVLISSVVGIIILGEVRDWVTRNSRLAWKRILSSRILLICTVASACFTLLMGVLFWDSSNKNLEAQSVITLTQETYRLTDEKLLAETQGDRDALEKAIFENGKKIDEKEQKIYSQSKPMSLVKMVAISISNTLFMFLASVMFALLMLITAIYKAERKKEKIKKQAVDLFAQFQAQKNAIIQLNKLGGTIGELHGRLVAVRLMQSAENNTTELINPEPKENITSIVSMNGHAKHETVTSA